MLRNFMKMIKILFYKALSLILLIFSTGCLNLYSQSLLMGTIQFTKSASLDPIRIYYGGKIISTNAYETNIPKITYEITKNNEQNVFYLLITQTPLKHHLKNCLNDEDDNNTQNTIEYLKIHPETPYKLYELVLTLDTLPEALDQQISPESYHWNITEVSLSKTGQLPDATIIVNYFATFVKTIKGGNAIELPTIFVDNSLIDQFGTQENFEDALIKLQLTSLDTDMLHAPIRRKMKNDKHRILIMDTIT